MKDSVFLFLRATFYRFMQQWQVICTNLDDAPKVLAVGDLHLENFGTWRDEEGRLVWGINDFDETYRLPYTLDLVRLATSLRLASLGDTKPVRFQAACNGLLEGYQAGLAFGRQPFVLEEQHFWLRQLAVQALADPTTFWRKLQSQPSVQNIPAKARKQLIRNLPDTKLAYQVVHRIAGMGSLGRARFVAIAEFKGGLVAREVKQLAPSAVVWAGGGKTDLIHSAQVLRFAIRCVHPVVRVQGNWIIRQLAPDSIRIELAQLSKVQDQLKLFYAMAFETANIHLGSQKAIKSVRRDLKGRDAGWLERAAEAMAKVTLDDWVQWKQG